MKNLIRSKLIGLTFFKLSLMPQCVPKNEHVEGCFGVDKIQNTGRRLHEEKWQHQGQKSLLYHLPKTKGRLVTRDFSSHLTVIALQAFYIYLAGKEAAVEFGLTTLQKLTVVIPVIFYYYNPNSFFYNAIKSFIPTISS